MEIDLNKLLDDAKNEHEDKLLHAEFLRTRTWEVLSAAKPDLLLAISIGHTCGDKGIRSDSLVCDRQEFERRKDSNEL